METNLDSGQVEIIGPYGRVYLYTHSNSKDLINIMHQVLSKKLRWNDPDYLARMIFCKMIPFDEWDSDLGYGIGTQLYRDVNILVSIDTVHQTINISSYHDKQLIHGKISSFTHFIKNFADDAEL